MKFNVDIDVPVPAADGTRLATNIWRPVADGPMPALLVRTPYGKDDIGGYAVGPNLFALLEAGYAVAIQECRGTFRSEGEFVPHEADAGDGAATVTWLTEQPWCDGNVGAYGVSYLGFVQWHTASTGVAGLKAIAPMFSSGDVYRAPWHSPGGALSLGTTVGWTTRMATVKAMRDHADRETAAGLGAAVANLEAEAAVAPVTNHPLLHQTVPWFGNLIGHAARDEFWQDIAAIDHSDRIVVPALNIGGWYDVFIHETLNAYTTMRRQGGSPQARKGQRLIIGPWGHTPETYFGKYPDRNFGPAAAMIAADLTGAQLAFFDRWLRGQDGALDKLAPVRIFVMGIDRWRDEQEWPLPDTRYTDYFLGGGIANTADGSGTLTTTAQGAGVRQTYLYDPRRPVPTRGGTMLGTGTDYWIGPADQRDVEAREDVLCFTTPLLEEPVEVTGHVSLKVFVSSSAQDTDFTGKLVDVHPDGRGIILCEGIQRARYRNSLTTEELLTPGEVYELTIDLGVTSNVFLPGHRIRLEVSSSNFPRYDRNSNTGGVIAEEAEEDMVVAINHVLHGQMYPSRLVLPVIDR